jgi:hypothetical protein
LGFFKKFETRTVRQTGLSDSLIMLHLSILMDWVTVFWFSIFVKSF